MSTALRVRQGLGRHPGAHPLDYRVLLPHRRVPDQGTTLITLAEYVRQTPKLESVNSLIKKAIEYASWEPGWDGAGAEKISILAVQNFLRILRSTFPVIELPHIAPAMTGEILVQWAFGDHDYIEIYVGENDVFPTEAHAVQNGNISDHALTDVGTLVRLVARVRARSY